VKIAHGPDTGRVAPEEPEKAALLGANGVIRHRWVFPKIGVPQNGWFIMENPIQMDDLREPLFFETPRLVFINSPPKK